MLRKESLNSDGQQFHLSQQNKNDLSPQHIEQKERQWHMALENGNPVPGLWRTRQCVSLWMVFVKHHIPVHNNICGN